MNTNRDNRAQPQPVIVHVKHDYGILGVLIKVWLFGVFYFAWLAIKWTWQLSRWCVVTSWRVFAAVGKWTIMLSIAAYRQLARWTVAFYRAAVPVARRLHERYGWLFVGYAVGVFAGVLILLVLISHMALIGR